MIEASGNSEDVAFKLFAKTISFDFLAHSPIKEDPALVIVVDFEGLGGSLSGVRNTELSYEGRHPFIDDHKKIMIL